MADEDNNQGSPRYVDETTEADPNLRPNLEETEERKTDQEPVPEEKTQE